MDNTQSVDIKALHRPVQSSLEATNALILKQIISEVPLVEDLCQHAIKSGGKRLRPLVVLLCSQALGYEGTQQCHLAAIVEFIHTATLLHDDVVDKSELRRGEQAANIIWGNEASVLAGDFLLSRALEMMVDLESTTILRILARTTNQITGGEIQQLMQRHNPDYSETRYFEMIRCKTALLFAAASECAALLMTPVNPTYRQVLKNYGMELGLAFQLVDDALDYDGDVATLGKNVGDDLADGKPTLPILYALAKGTAAEKHLIETSIKEGNITQLPAIKAAIESTGAIQYTYARAAEHGAKAQEALSVLPESPAKTALMELVAFALKRRH